MALAAISFTGDGAHLVMLIMLGFLVVLAAAGLWHRG